MTAAFASPRSWMRLLSMTLAWLALVNGNLSSLLVGVPFIIAAWTLANRLVPPAAGGFVLGGFLRFAPWFLVASVVAGYDVARRALSPRPDLEPDTIHYPFRLPDGPARVFFVDVISLLPGTLSADLDQEAITVHALDIRQDHLTSLRDLEARVAQLFGLRLEERA